MVLNLKDFFDLNRVTFTVEELELPYEKEETTSTKKSKEINLKKGVLK